MTHEKFLAISKPTVLRITNPDGPNVIIYIAISSAWTHSIGYRTIIPTNCHWLVKHTGIIERATFHVPEEPVNITTYERERLRPISFMKAKAEMIRIQFEGVKIKS